MANPQSGKKKLIGCPNCDLLINKNSVQEGYNICCPRCKYVLRRSCRNSINRTLALSITGLLFFFPACLMPLLTLNSFGLTANCTMVRGVFQMFSNGYWWMSFLVLFSSVLVPFITLFLLATITFLVKTGHYSATLRKVLKLYQTLHEWVMLDVYIIGILIAYLKMDNFGDLHTGPGLLFFTGLLIMAIMASITFDINLIWNRFEVFDK
jgi:paraquat-inducible protein A